MNNSRAQTMMSVRLVFLFIGLLIGVAAMLQMAFTRNLLHASHDLLLSHNENQFVQIDTLYDLRHVLMKIEIVAGSEHMIWRSRTQSVQMLASELVSDWRRFNIKAPDSIKHSAKYSELGSRIENVIEHLQDVGSYRNEHEFEVLNFEINQCYPMLEWLSSVLLENRAALDSKNLGVIENFQNNYQKLTVALSVILLCTLLITYRFAVSPLKLLGQIAIRVGRGLSEVREFTIWNSRLRELDELRNTMHTMALDLTEAGRIVSKSSAEMLELTQKVSMIARRVRNSVIDERSIGKELFEDVLELRDGERQFNEALVRAEKLLSDNFIEFPDVKDKLNEVGIQLQIAIDVMKSWHSIDDELGRVVSMFEMMVSDRMLLADELDLLSKDIDKKAAEIISQAA